MVIKNKYVILFFSSKCNLDMVELLPLELEEDQKYVESLLREFNEKTGSLIAKQLIDTWPEPTKKFVKVFGCFNLCNVSLYIF